MQTFPCALVLALLVACGSSSSASTPSGSTCDELESSASSDVEAAIANGASCTTDTDCTDVGFSAGCFNSCTRAVNKSSVADVDAAKKKVDGAQCKQFAAQGCKKTIPPCAPPDAPKCVANKCQ